MPTDPREPESLRCNGIKMGEVKDRVLTFKDGPLEGGTGCILIKKRGFEKLRFLCKYEYASFDVYFWRDINRAGFSGAVDGHVVCGHLDDCTFKDAEGNVVFENIKGTNGE